MNFKIVALFFTALGTHFAAAAASDVVQVPDSCIQKMQYPCLIQSEKPADLKFSFKTKSDVLRVYEKTVVKIVSHGSGEEATISYELVKGKMKIQTDKASHIQKTIINETEVESTEGVYVSRQDSQVRLLNLENLDYIVLQPLLAVSKGPKYKLIEKKLLPRKEMVNYILLFPDIRPNLRKTLAHSLKLYDLKFKEELQDQTKVLQRSIASEAAEKEKNAKASQRLEAERKKTRQLFFQRTFER